MTKPSEWVLKAILTQCPEERRATLESFLPQAERLHLQSMPLFEAEFNAEEPPLLDRIHWSWLLSPLKSYAPQEQKLFLSVLPEIVRNNLTHEIGLLPFSWEDPGTNAKTYLTQTLLKQVIGPIWHILPMNFLPPSPLSPLLKLSKKELIRLIDFLSLYDLAAELRQIVETKMLKKIYSFLTEGEKKFLKQATSAHAPLSAMRLIFEGWDGTEEAFRNLLHKRGLTRLGAALSTQHSDFCWYICHQLDIGRGTALAKLSSVEVSHEISEAIIRQIEAALERKDKL